MTTFDRQITEHLSWVSNQMTELKYDSDIVSLKFQLKRLLDEVEKAYSFVDQHIDNSRRANVQEHRTTQHSIQATGRG